VPEIAGSERAEPAPLAPVTIRVVSLGGPFARGTLAAPTGRAPVRNDWPKAVVVVYARVSPLVEEHTRLAVAQGALTAEVAAGALAAGEAAMVKLGGAVPGRPGTYTAHLDVRCDAGPPPHSRRRCA